MVFQSGARWSIAWRHTCAAGLAAPIVGAACFDKFFGNAVLVVGGSGWIAEAGGIAVVEGWALPHRVVVPFSNGISSGSARSEYTLKYRQVRTVVK